MSNRTKFLSRLIGLYCLLVSLIMMSQKHAMVRIEKTFVGNPAMLFILGIFILVAGLAMVVGHNRWSGGVLTVSITVLGWIALIKGLLLTIPDAAAILWGSLEYERLYYMYVAIAFIFGVGLTSGGFRQPPQSRDHGQRPRIAA